MGDLCLGALPNLIICPSLCPRRLTPVGYMVQFSLVTDVQMGLATGAALADDIRVGGSEVGVFLSFSPPPSSLCLWK